MINRRNLLLGVLGAGAAALLYPGSIAAAAHSPSLNQLGAAAETSSDLRLPPINHSRDGILHAGKRRTDSSVWLTFDDGGSPRQVGRILDVLRHDNVRGVFFPLGSFAREQPGLIRTMKTDGHMVGNHSYSHPNFSRLSAAGIRSQVTAAERAIGPNTTPKLFRCPYGSGAFEPGVLAVLASMGYQSAYWTVDTQDWKGSSAPTIVQRVARGEKGVTPRVESRGVVLMHMSGRNTGTALPGVIKAIRDRRLQLPKLR